MSFLRDYVLDLEKQEKALWSALEYLGITGGAPLALILYVVAFAITVRTAEGWKSVLLCLGGVVALCFLLLQRAAFHHFITRVRKERAEAENALTSHLNTQGATDALRTVDTSLKKLKAVLDRF